MNKLQKRRMLIATMVIAVGLALFSGIMLIKSNFDDPKEIEENCFTINRDAIKKILKGDFTNPDSPDYVEYLCIAIAKTSPVEIEIIPQVKDGKIDIAKKEKIKILSTTSIDCLLEVNQKDTSSIPAIYFANTNGSLAKFKFIRFKAKSTYGITVPMNIFDVYTVKENIFEKEIATYRGITYPCPPYCRPD